MHNSLQPTVVLLGLAAALMPSPCRANDLELVRAGYAQRSSMIRSVQAVYRLQAVELASGTTRDLDVFEWTAQGDQWRYRKGQDDMEKIVSNIDRGPSILDLPVDAVASAEKLTTVAKMLDGQHQATISTASDDVFAYSDFRSRMLDYVHDSPPIAVADVLSGNHGEATCRQLESGLYAVNCTPEQGHDVEITFDPEKNFAVRSIENFYRTNDRFTGYRIEANDFLEAAPGVWFPESTDKYLFRRSASGDPEAPTGVNRCLVTQLKINEEIPPGKFDIELSPGTEVDNQITGKRYLVQADGTASPVEPLPELQVNSTFETTDAKPSMSTWIIATNLLLLGIAGVSLLIRRQL